MLTLAICYVHALFPLSVFHGTNNYGTDMVPGGGRGGNKATYYCTTICSLDHGIHSLLTNNVCSAWAKALVSQSMLE
jgi:hypothetical protein